MGKKSRSGSEMNILDHAGISESLNPGIRNLFDPESGIRDGKNSDPG
jgi:hypothetical protein